MPAIIGDLNKIKAAESYFRDKAEDYRSICKSIENSLETLGGWEGKDNRLMIIRVRSGLGSIRMNANTLENQADHLYRWRISIEYSQDSMLSMIKGLG